MPQDTALDYVPNIDLSPLLDGDDPDVRAQIAAEIDTACTQIGFFTITGHGVSADLIDRTRTMAVDFFALSEADKLKVERPKQRISRGYSGFGDRALGFSLGVATPPDLHEAYAFGPDLGGDVTSPLLAPNLWPDAPEGFRETLNDYYAAMTELSGRVLELMGLALGIEPGFFADKFDRQASMSRLIRYPALTEPPQPGQLRSGEHTDYGTLTFLRGDDTPGGLQVKLRHGEWVDVHPDPDAFIINIGDMMMRWTNDKWISNLHRVAVPPASAKPQDRISLVFFQMPNPETEIRCIETCRAADGSETYPPELVSDLYLGKAQKTARQSLDAGTATAVDS